MRIATDQALIYYVKETIVSILFFHVSRIGEPRAKGFRGVFVVGMDERLDLL